MCVSLLPNNQKFFLSGVELARQCEGLWVRLSTLVFTNIAAWNPDLYLQSVPQANLKKT